MLSFHKHLFFLSIVILKFNIIHLNVLILKNVHVIYPGNKQAKFRLKGQGDINEGSGKFYSAQMTICF